MLTSEQVAHYKTFGFVVIRNVFAPAEVDVIRTEFERRAADNKES